MKRVFENLLILYHVFLRMSKNPEGKNHAFQREGCMAALLNLGAANGIFLSACAKAGGEFYAKKRFFAELMRVMDCKLAGIVI